MKTSEFAKQASQTSVETPVLPFPLPLPLVSGEAGGPIRPAARLVGERAGVGVLLLGVPLVGVEKAVMAAVAESASTTASQPGTEACEV